jgi:hypothetical protein
MKSAHIDNSKLYEVVTKGAVLEPAEAEHLETCEKCLETIRVFVHQSVLKGATA